MPPPVPGETRLFAKNLRAWVFAAPSPSAAKLGYLRSGASSKTSAKPAGHDGCPGGWFRVEPEGFVCAGPTATVEANDPTVIATRGTHPDLSRRLPYIYGTVRKPGPVYARVPNASELSQAEPDLAERMEAWLGAEGEVGARYAPQVWLAGAAPGLTAAQAWAAQSSDPVPPFLELAGRSANQPAVAERMKIPWDHDAAAALHAARHILHAAGADAIARAEDSTATTAADFLVGNDARRPTLVGGGDRPCARGGRAGSDDAISVCADPVSGAVQLVHGLRE
jgi:hypothetical protein